MKTMCPPGYHDNGFVATHIYNKSIFDHLRILSSLKAKCAPSIALFMICC